MSGVRRQRSGVSKGRSCLPRRSPDCGSKTGISPWMRVLLPVICLYDLFIQTFTDRAERYHSFDVGRSMFDVGRSSSRCLCKMLIISLFFAITSFSAAEPSIKVSVESESRFVHEPFVLKVDVISEKDTGRPSVADGAGYTVSSISQGRRLPYSRKDTTTFRVEVVASQTGVITIAPVEVDAGGLLLKSAPLRLVVDEPHSADNMTLGAVFSQTNLYVNQAVEMTVQWQSKMPFIQYQELAFDLPVLRNPGLAVYPLEPDVPEKKRICLPVNEQRVIGEKYSCDLGAGIRFRYMIVPLQSGVFAKDEICLACALMKDKQNSNQYPSYFNNNFFSVPDHESRFERVYLTSPIDRLYVSALPEEGRSPLFCGVAGPLSVSTAITPQDVVVGQPMMFEVELSNMTFGGQITELPDVILSNIGPSFKLTSDPIRQSKSADGHKFVYALRPLRSAVNYVPALAMQVFDPEAGSYRMVRSKPIRIRVDPDEGKKTFVPATVGDDNLLVSLNGVRSNRKQSGVLMNGYNLLSFIGEKALLIWLLAPVAWLLIRRKVRHLERCRVDAQYARSAGAMRRFKQAVHEDEELALRNYLADRFGLCAEAITTRSCVSVMQNKGVSHDIVDMVSAYFEAVDSKKYSPAGEADLKRKSVHKLVKAVEHGSKILLLLVFAVPLVSMAVSPDENFNRALEMNADRPDEARPVFVEAALGYEKEQAFFNAGNSWFFAGENGRALAAYLAAESRAPFDSAIRESIDFIRAQCPDGFEVEQGLTSGMVRILQRFCRWDVRLRLGVLTILYLLGWYIYILYRVFGWRPGRRFCAAYASVLLFLALTLLYSAFQPSRGVVVQSAGARLGPGYAYGSACEGVLSPAVEFAWLGTERGWVHAQLPDGTEAWMHESACVRVP